MATLSSKSQSSTTGAERFIMFTAAQIKSMSDAAAAYIEALNDPDRAVNVVDSTKLPAIFAPVIANAESAARNTHQEWLDDARARGVTREENPNCVPYDELPAETKAANLSAALRTYKVFCYLGVEFTNVPTQVDEDKLANIIYLTTEVIHDGWSKDKIAAGWSFAPQRDNDAKKHTDLLDLGTLLEFWPGKDEWDRNAVCGAMNSLQKDYGIYPVIA